MRTLPLVLALAVLVVAPTPTAAETGEALSASPPADGAEPTPAPSAAAMTEATAASSSVHPAEPPAPADPAWSAFLDTVPPPGPAVRPVDPPTAGVKGVAAWPIGVAVVLLLALGAHPRTRAILKARAGGLTDGGLPIELRGARLLPGGQRVAIVDADGMRLVLGLSPGRIDLLHAQPVLGDASATPAPADGPDEDTSPFRLPLSASGDFPFRLAGGPLAEPPRDIATAQDASPLDPPAAPSALDGLLALRRDALQPSPTPRRTPKPAAPPQDAWWLEGATVEERSRLSMSGETDGALPSGRALRAVLSLLVLTLPIWSFTTALAGDGAVPIGPEPAASSTALKMLATLTFVAVAPAIVLSMTAFTRIIVVFSLLRQALGVQQAPPNQILIGLALFLTWFVMAPTFERVHEDAVTPYLDGAISEVEAVDTAMGPMKSFMLKNTRDVDLALFLRLDRAERPRTREDVPARVIVPAFVISELRTAFQIGFLLYIPFLVVDLVVSTVLLAMGMMVLPPIVVSLPFKLLLFVFVDGWALLVSSLVRSFA